MLRTSANTLVRATSWKNPAMYSSIKFYSTPAPVPEAEKPSLSERLGGTGRGKITDSADPFSLFLKNAKKNNNRTGNFKPRNRKQFAENKGQFDDAPTEGEAKTAKPRQTRDEQVANSNNEHNNNNNNRRSRNHDRNNNDNNNNNNNKQFNSKRLNLRRSQPQEVRARRATTFIDRDIDWASFDTTSVTSTESESVQDTTDDNELILKDIQGDYDRYLGVGAEIKWADIVKGDAVSNLVGSNFTLDLQQKTAFLNTVSKATTISARK